MKGVECENLISFWSEQGFDKKIITAFKKVPREIFVSPELRSQAYEDRPLPTIRGQSLSQPTTVMIMTQALEVAKGQKILEVGAGVGFQATLLAELTGKRGTVFTTEIIPELVEAAKKNTSHLGYHNVLVLETDGSRGVEQQAPFDRIIITAACPKIPEPLIEQTKDQGIIVAPLGNLQEQILVKARKIGHRLEMEFLGPFMFVPLQGKYGFEELNDYLTKN